MEEEEAIAAYWLPLICPFASATEVWDCSYIDERYISRSDTDGVTQIGESINTPYVTGWAFSYVGSLSDDEGYTLTFQT